MSKKGKQRSVLDLLRELLEQLEQLVRPGKLQPVRIPVRNRRRK